MKRTRQEKVIITGPAGQIEARLEMAAGHADDFAIVCHPHPLHGGTMDNKVAHTAARALCKAGMPVARFNFRGVGGSAGGFDHGAGEQDDLAAVAAWARSRFPGRGLVLAGFSFGAYVAAAQAQTLSARRLITIAPPVAMYDFAAIEYRMPWLVIMGDADEVVPAEAAREWLRQWSQTPSAASPRRRHAEWMTGAGHFFHGRLPELAGRIRAWLDAQEG